MDITLHVPHGKTTYDISFENGDIAHADDLETLVVISLFSWARAKDGDDVPARSPRFGWWGDQVADDTEQRMGSRLWLLQRRKMTQETINDAVQYCKEALAWMETDGIASRITFTPEAQEHDQLDMVIALYRRDGQARTLRFSDLWQKVGGTWLS